MESNVGLPASALSVLVQRDSLNRADLAQYPCLNGKVYVQENRLSSALSAKKHSYFKLITHTSRGVSLKYPNLS